MAQSIVQTTGPTRSTHEANHDLVEQVGAFVIPNQSSTGG